MDTNEKTRIKVVMLPWLAYGHISPYLELAKKLSKRDFYVYFCSTSINLSSIRKKLAVDDHDAIQLIEFQLTSQTELPPHHHTTKGLPPHLIPDLIKALGLSGPNVINILNTVNPDLIIYDVFQLWVPAFAASLQIPAVHFQVVGALSTAAVYRFKVDSSIPVPCSRIFLDDTNIRKSPDYDSSSGENSGIVDLTFGTAIQSSDIILIKSSREFDEKNIEYYSLLMDKKIVPTGPLVQVNTCVAVHTENEKDDIMDWLSKKEESSTVYVSFGSECYLSEPRIRELAHGLELSNVNFIWVISFPEGDEEMCNTSIEDVLPEGFLDRVKDRGVIVSWAPQERILGHGGLGGFVSHCGWGSVVEAMSYGVPIIAMPAQYEQPLHAMFVEEVGVGVEVLKDESGEFRRDEIAKAIKKVVVEKNGEGVRKKAREMGKAIKKRGEEEVECVVEELTKLCKKYQKVAAGQGKEWP